MRVAPDGAAPPAAQGRQPWSRFSARGRVGLSGDRTRRKLILKRTPISIMDIPNDQSYNMTMKQIAAAKFKEHCLALLDEVDPDGIVITKRGRPVAKLIPFASDSASLIGSLTGKLTIKGDILSTGLDWDAER